MPARSALVVSVNDAIARLPPTERKTELANLANLVRELGGPGLEAQPPSGSKRTMCIVISGLLLVLVPALRVAGFSRWNHDERAVTRVEAHGYMPCAPLQQPPAILSGVSSGAAAASWSGGFGERISSLPHGGESRLLLGGPRERSNSLGSGSSGGIGKETYRRPSGFYPSHGAFQHPRDALLKTMSPGRNTSDFPLLVCIGQGKTATKSLNKAMVMLGFRTAHFYGAGIYGLLYDNAAEAGKQDFLFNVNEEHHVDAVLDTPVVEFYNEILLAYPNARIILTIREPRSWLKSQQKFYCCYARGCRNWLAPWRRGSNLVYGTECPSKAQALKRYVQHNRNVYDNVPREKLLIMDIPGGDGWEKLIPFLNSFMPKHVPMPPNNFTFPSRH